METLDTVDLNQRFNRRSRQREGIILGNNNAERLLRDSLDTRQSQSYQESEFRVSDGLQRMRISDLRRRGTYRQEHNVHRVTMTIRRQVRKEMLRTRHPSGK